MNISDLTHAMNEFVSHQGWYGKDSKKPQTLKNLSISLVLEATEVLEQFQWGEKLNDKTALEEELADVFLYLLQIASIAGIDLEQATLVKLKKNYSRSWDE